MQSSKWFVVGLLLAVISAWFAGTVSASEPVADIAYIVKTSNGVDSYLLNQITDAGYTYRIIYEANVSNTDFAQFRMILVGDERLDVPNNIPYDTHKTIVINSYNYYKKSLTNYQIGWSSSSGTVSSPTLLTIDTTSGSEILEGLPARFNAYAINNPNVKTSYLRGQKPAGAKLVIYSSISSNTVVATLDKGRTLLNGKTLQERNVFFGITKAQYWTDQTELLFRNSLQWLLVGEDFDNDGFYSDVDCNDFNSEIYPGALEIPYDRIDQDCNGADFADVDEDGFCKQGYLIQDKVLQCQQEIGIIGTDCDENDFTVNLFNPDPLFNCVNDPPYLETFDGILTFSEGEEVVIPIGGEDPDGDSLVFSINDSRFIFNNDNFIWQTSYDDSGRYVFEVSVSDGQLVTKKNAAIRILNTNRDLFFDAIPDVVWSEDSSFVLNLSNYAHDPDRDALVFGIENTSDNDQIIVNEIGNGLFNFSSVRDFNGEDWIEFWAFDGESASISNRAVLRVLAVNDAPIFNSNIPNITWDEDTVLEDVTNLTDYFSDIDSELSYKVTGNNKIEVIINNGLVSFHPEEDFFGTEEIYFTANDSEFEVPSNRITLTVEDMGEPPVFENLTCETTIEEDISHRCLLEASDFENDEITFSVVAKSHLNCTILGTELTYVSEKDYNGAASCELKASDSDGEGRKTLSVNVTAVNDAPEILSALPEQDVVNAIEGFPKNFSIRARDVDSRYNLSWILDGAELNNSPSTFLFNKPKGIYSLEAKVSDNEYSVSEFWNIIVGGINEFSCSEVGGFVCSDKQLCAGNILGVRDSNSCCSIRCEPSFKNVGCRNLNNSLGIEIKNVSNIELGSVGKIELELTNELEEKQKFDIEAYLYNLKKDKAVAKTSLNNIEVAEGRAKIVNLDLEIPSDINLADEYAIFVKATDKICNQEYLPADVERAEKMVTINEFSIPARAACGSTINAEVDLENLGTTNQNVNIFIKNSDLNINEESGLFSLSAYNGDNDKETKGFVIDIPENIEQKSYELEISVSYSGIVEKTTRTVEIECVALEESSPDLEDNEETIVLNSEQQITNSTQIGRTNSNVVFAKIKEAPLLSVALVITLDLLVLAVALYFIFLKNSKIKTRKER